MSSVIRLPKKFRIGRAAGRFGVAFACVVVAQSKVHSQVNAFPYVEHFDSVTAPNFPAGWNATLFASSTTSPRSAPNAVSATGNTTLKTLVSPAFDFTGKFPDRLMYFERRSSTAVSYRLEVRAALDGVNFNSVLATFDTITSTSAYVQRTIDLASAALQNQPSTRFRWQILNDNTNSTGVIRIDDLSLIVQTAFDLKASSLVTFPGLPTTADSITLTATVKNLATQWASGYSVDFYRDANANAIPEANEKFHTALGPTIAAGDSTSISAGHPRLKVGDHKFFFIVNLPNDENRSNDTLAITIAVGYARNALVVNEIMYAPQGDEPEWVELFNPSQDTVNLRNWRLSDNNVGTKTPISATEIRIPPAGYAVVAQNANFLTVHPNVVSPVLIANFSAFNNTTADAVVLYDSRLTTIDSLTYLPTWGGGGGKSLERKEADALATLQANWATSEDSIGRTPGRVNSIVKLPFDLAIDSVRAENFVFVSGPAAKVSAWVSNRGKNLAPSFSVAFFADTNRNHQADAEELLQRVSAGPIAADEQTEIQFDYLNAPSGSTTVLVSLEFSKDQRSRNNEGAVSVRAGFPPRALVINEFLYEPLTGQNEWLELYNPNTFAVDVDGWKFSDRPTASGSVNTFTVSSARRIVSPQSFLILAADSSILEQFPSLASSAGLVILNRVGGFSFNSDGDAITLQDLTGSTVDSVAYLPSWHNPDVADTHGRSLERITPSGSSNDRRNWSTCVLVIGGTPGAANSINTASGASDATLSFSPNPFSPNGDGFEDFCLVRYNLPYRASSVHVRIFDVKGRLIRTLANAELASATGEIPWDGLDDSKNHIRVGVYVVFLEATESGAGNSSSAKGVVVVAR